MGGFGELGEHADTNLVGSHTRTRGNQEIGIDKGFNPSESIWEISG